MDVHGKTVCCKKEIRMETEIINLIKKSEKFVGMKQVLRGLSEGTIKSVIIAQDADYYIKNKIETYAKDCKVEIKHLDSKEKLGKAAGIDIGAAVVGLIK